MNRTLSSLRFAAILCAGGLAGWFLRGMPVADHPAPLPPPVAASVAAASPTPSHPATPGPEAEAAPSPPTDLSAVPAGERLTADLAYALEDGAVSAEFRGNARDQLRMVIVNRSAQPVRLSIPAGQAFEGTRGKVIVPRARILDFAPGETRLETLGTLATASTNQVEDGAFALAAVSPEKLQGLLRYLGDHPEVSLPAAQTAALAILENLPASAFAKFTGPGGDLPALWNTAAFKVEVVDLVGALIVLRQLGIPDEQLAITVDPQTRIEAMIDPLAHAAAMEYYGIKPENEWAYWKHELLQGEPGTRHYALHGIARYFPDVALSMLPAWARERRTNPIFRRVAIEALAETGQPEALTSLHALETELRNEAELAKAAHDAARYLQATLDRNASDIPPVAFRFATSGAAKPGGK